ncbi:MAG: multifunctional CCA protein [Gammaproteobacteria bacterium]|nr:MAG: multifunctional CCA protein [Gammaproteobacteria bacterium]
MKVYKVGGAVRDKLLGLPVHEHDYVVVGATPEQLRALGFREVGRDFPVFLHPETGEEYALARTERKSGPGHRGFRVEFGPDIPLEKDLERRDLTINAIAEDAAGRLIDPYGGLADLEARRLRHVSEAFVEDPLRVLRVARFHAKLAPLGFHVAPETLALMRRIADSGELEHLTAERVFRELEKALATPCPWVFFETLAACGALPRLFPELADGGRLARALAALRRAAALDEAPELRFAALAAAALDEAAIDALCRRLKTPRAWRELALLTRRHRDLFEQATRLPPPDILAGLKALDALRRPERFERFLRAAEAVAGSEPGRERWPWPQADYLRAARDQAAAVTARDLLRRDLEGPALAAELDAVRCTAIAKLKRRYRWSVP